MNYQELSEKVAAHVSMFYMQNPDTGLPFHNRTRVLELLDNVKKMSAHYELDERNNFIVHAAAWFHDTGFLIPGSSSPEAKSAGEAEAFLKSIGANEDDIAEIEQSILAAQSPQNPASLPAKILCDADLFYLGTEGFKEKNKMLRKEIEVLQDHSIGGGTWREQTIALMEQHVYHTDYCQMLLNKTKADNLESFKIKQEDKLAKKIAHTAEKERKDKEDQTSDTLNEKTLEELEESITSQEKKAVKQRKKHGDKKKKDNRLARGVETMLRTSTTNYQRLSTMADSKAHIMISVNAIIISIAIGLVVGKFGENRGLIAPTALLLIVNVIAIIYSILATRPKRSKGVVSKDQIEKKTANLLFFGSFYKMGYEDYELGMKKMMGDSEYLYGSLLRNLYWQGRVLGRKFHLLRISYDVFMYGIAASVIAYILSAVFLIES